jgi:hypothetical protein
MACGQSIVFLIIFYIIAFIYVKEPHYKYFGYIMLIIIYIFSLGIGLQNAGAISTGFATFSQMFLQNILIRNLFMLSALSIVVFNLYSLIRVINAYWFKTKSMKSFDLKLNKRHQKNLNNFDNSFIVGNIALALLIISFIGTGLPVVDQIIQFPVLQAFLFLIAFVCVWIETAYSTKFSYIKRD